MRHLHDIASRGRNHSRPRRRTGGDVHRKGPDMSRVDTVLLPELDGPVPATLPSALGLLSLALGVGALVAPDPSPG